MENENFISNEDLNNNGIPDWAESFDRKSVNRPLPEGEDNDFAYEYDNEESIKQYIPNFREYKWYQQPDTKKYYSYGEKIEDIVESNPEESKEMLDNIVEEDNGVSKEDVKPLLDEINQINDDNPNNDEVNNEKVEEFIKNPKIGGFLSDSLDYISKEDYDKMPIDDIADADKKAIEGEGPTLTVSDSIDPDNRYSIEDSLDEFANEKFSVNWPPKKETIGDKSYEYTGKEIPEEKKEEKINLKKLDENPGNMDIEAVNGSMDIPEPSIQSPITNDNNNITENIASTSGVSTTYPSFPGGSSGGTVSVGGANIDANIDNNNDAHSDSSGVETDVKVEEMDGNSAAMNGISNNEHLDDTFDSMSFKSNNNKSIETKKASLPSKEGHTSSGGGAKLEKKSSNINENPLVGQIVEKIISLSKMWQKDKNGWKTSGEQYLPFKFFVNNDSVEMTEIASGKKKKPIANWIKEDPTVIKRIQKRL